MAVLHKHDFVADPETVVDQIDGVTPWGAQCASNNGVRNSGGTTVAPNTPDRVTRVPLGGINFARLRTMSGDNFIAGSGSGYRCDLIPSGPTDASTWTGGHEGNIRVYRCKFLLRPSIDFVPAAGTWNALGPEFHKGGGGWPGTTFPQINYCGSATMDAPFQDTNIISGAKINQGDLFLVIFGGLTPTLNPSSTPNTINYESYPFLKAGVWENKIVDMAWRVKWASNFAESGGHVYYYKTVHGGTGTPTDLTNSGWIELQYRIGTINADGSITWTQWSWYDPGTMVFGDGGRQVWVNGASAFRHYRPTIFRASDTGVDTGSYWKLANYHSANGSDSSVYVADPIIADAFADVGLADPGATPPPSSLLGDQLDTTVLDGTAIGSRLNTTPYGAGTLGDARNDAVYPQSTAGGGGGGGTVVTDLGTTVNAVNASNFNTGVTIDAGCKLLVVALHRRYNNTVNTITVNGVAMTLLGGVNGGGIVPVDVYYMVNPPAGAQTIAVTMSGAGAVMLGATQLGGSVDTVTPFRSQGGPSFLSGSVNPGTNINLSLASVAGDLCLSYVSKLNDTDSTITPNQTSLYDQVASQSSGANAVRAGCQKAGGATSVATNWTFGAATTGAGLACSVKGS